MRHVADGSGRYVPLLRSFVSDEVDAETFKDRFLDWWREDRDNGVVIGEVVDNLMTAVDLYDENPNVLHRIDAEQLRAEAADALRLLTAR